MENFDNIKVGDQVVISTSLWGIRLGTVDKVTPKRFKVGGTTFTKENGFGYGSGWSSDRCLHVTDELMNKIARQQEFAKMRRILRNVRVNSYNYEQTKLLYNFMVEHSLIIED